MDALPVSLDVNDFTDYLPVIGISILIHFFAPFHYGLFSGPWIKAHRKTITEHHPNMAATHLVALLNTTFLVSTISYYLGLLQATTVSAVIIHLGIFGLAFTVIPLANHHNFAHGLQASVALSIIDGSYDLVMIIGAGLALNYFK